MTICSREIDLIDGSSEGWFYGADFQSLSEKNLKAKPSLPVRQRRWIRIVTKTAIEKPPMRPPKAQSSSSSVPLSSETLSSQQRLPPAIRRNSSQQGSDDGGRPGSRESSVAGDSLESQTQSQSSWFSFGGSSEIAQKYIIKDSALQAIGKQLK
jgi:hypothetical protein